MLKLEGWLSPAPAKVSGNTVINAGQADCTNTANIGIDLQGALTYAVVENNGILDNQVNYSMGTAQGNPCGIAGDVQGPHAA